jgi:hypothetical protein
MNKLFYYLAARYFLALLWADNGKKARWPESKLGQYLPEGGRRARC